MDAVLWRGTTMARQAPAAAPAMRSFRLSDKDDDILSALSQFYFLTAEQVTRLFYSPNSLTYVQTKLKGLTDAGYTHRLFFQQKRPARATYVYYLARKGLHHLHDSGREVEERSRPSERDTVSDL